MVLEQEAFVLAITSGSCKGTFLMSVGAVLLFVISVTVLGYCDVSLELLGVDSESRELSESADIEADFLVVPS